MTIPKEVHNGASQAMNGLFKIYFHSKDGALRAKCREMMEVMWAWYDAEKAKDESEAVAKLLDDAER